MARRPDPSPGPPPIWSCSTGCSTSIWGMEVCRRLRRRPRRQRPDDHADRARRGERSRTRARERRRRLSPSRSPRASWSRGCARCCAGSARPWPASGCPTPTSRWTSPPIACAAAAADTARADRIPPARVTSSSIPAGSSRASGCSMRSGATILDIEAARSTSISGGCARRSTRRPARSDPHRPLRRLRARQ